MEKSAIGASSSAGIKIKIVFLCAEYELWADFFYCPYEWVVWWVVAAFSFFLLLLFLTFSAYLASH